MSRQKPAGMGWGGGLMFQVTEPRPKQKLSRRGATEWTERSNMFAGSSCWQPLP